MAARLEKLLLIKLITSLTKARWVFRLDEYKLYINNNLYIILIHKSRLISIRFLFKSSFTVIFYQKVLLKFYTNYHILLIIVNFTIKFKLYLYIIKGFCL